MTEWLGRQVLVTGAAGFIGANLTHALTRAGAHVFALVRPSTDRWRLASVDPTCTIVPADLLDAEAMSAAFRFAQPSIVFHTAAVRGQFDTPHAIAMAKTATLLGTANVCRLSGELGVERLIHFGSSLEYGAANELLSETRALAPATGRGFVKAEETLFALQYARMSNLPVVMLRPFGAYGPWEDPTRAVPALMRCIVDGTELKLTDERVVHDFVYVDDVVAASLRAAVTPAAVGEILNIGTGVPTSNEDLVKAAERVCDTAVRVSSVPRPAWVPDAESWVADVRKTHQCLGWSARTTLDDGLRESYRWWLARASQLDSRSRSRPVLPR
jgi:nucleoside-diphosphate-sugar epimerase